MSTWVIIGASRGIGLEFVRQLLARGDRVVATVRDPAKASQLWALAGEAGLGACSLLECDVTSETSISVSQTTTKDTPFFGPPTRDVALMIFFSRALWRR